MYGLVSGILKSLTGFLSGVWKTGVGLLVGILVGVGVGDAEAASFASWLTEGAPVVFALIGSWLDNKSAEKKAVE